MSEVAFHEAMKEVERALVPDDSPPKERSRARDVLVDALAGAARRLRDAELELNAAREHYNQALMAFNRFVAPVAK